LKDLQKQGAKKFVLDLRNSGDGDEQEGVATANLFMNHGLISYVQGQKYPRQNFNADPSKAITNAPVVVLVNRSTAGPAEIIASSVLENARGDVLGDKTFGAGSIQKVLELPDSSALILSIAKFYSPSGKSIQDNAVTPNILVADNTDDFASPDDEMGRLATVFNETLGRLQQSFEQMRQFTSDVSHELRTPLTSIRSVGEVGLRGRHDEHGYRGIIGSMLEEVDRLARLVDRLLTLSRSEMGQAQLSPEGASLPPPATANP